MWDLIQRITIWHQWSFDIEHDFRTKCYQKAWPVHSAENHSEGKELEIPFYYYQYENGKVKYLFEQKMPQSNGLVANKNDILFGVQSDVNGDSVYRYNLKEDKTEKVKGLERLDKVFYLDEASEYLYKFNGKIGKVDLKTGEEEWLDNQFKEYYFTNYRLVKEQ